MILLLFLVAAALTAPVTRYEQCHVRFANLDFLIGRRNEATSNAWNPDSITVHMFPGSDPNDIGSIAFVTATVSMLMRETAKLAAYNASHSFATALMDTGGSFPTLYSMAQCTPDLSPDDCFACLDDIVQNIPKNRGSRGGRILGLRCSIRYDSDVFYGGKAMWIFGSTLRDVTEILNIGKVQLQGTSELDLHEEEALVWTTEGKVSSELWFFDFAQIKEATSNFSEENKLGQGGFGPVYKALASVERWKMA
ncbi:hypothetical protein BAE44_0013889 [Dichanthelium oligosanthes]|uniref:Gnk2-homologous domain-containing protein n=1 Tax=Dichanthelium oligosanthes TaxID=888268 RepID=A0A1E5VJ32_9POAL|nr:hypothetical protein BAE44_0013889 [Dichanthelium oligosanthes]